MAMIADGFDVALAREYGERLVALGCAANHPCWVAFLGDWRESLTGQREAHPDADVRTRWPAEPTGHDIAFARLGHRLLSALEGQPSECQRPYCEFGVTQDDDGYVRARPGKGYVRCETPAPAGVPSDDFGADHDGADVRLIRCPTCRGTGHNLSGVLPPVVDSEAAIATVADALAVEFLDPFGGRVGLCDWQREVYNRNRERVEALARADENGNPRTRVVPRGEHRTGDDPNEPPGAITGIRADIDTQGYEAGDMVRVRGYGYGRWAPRSTQRLRRSSYAAQADGKGSPESLMPRWRRGELLHAEQRRERAMAGPRRVVERRMDGTTNVWEREGSDSWRNVRTGVVISPPNLPSDQ